jgi:hypothetical protein
MAKFNKKGTDGRVEESIRLAGGFGAKAARQDDEALLRRAVMACLLWEDLAYESGSKGALNIAGLIPKVDPETVAKIAIETRTKQKLRHVPLWMALQMLNHKDHKAYVREVLNAVIQRPDQITDAIALWLNKVKKGGKKRGQPAKLPKQFRLAIADIFPRFSEYQLAKYNRDGEVKLRDAMFLGHPKPKDNEQAEVWKKLVSGAIQPPDTWEVALSAGKDKKETWTRLITDGKLGGLALLRNLRNMNQAEVPYSVVSRGLLKLNAKWLLPLNFMAAAKATPAFVREVEEAMFRCFAQAVKLPGHTAILVDVSGSMQAKVSAKSEFDRIDCAAAMAILATETCERTTVWATAGSDGACEHKTAWLPNYRGFGLMDKIREASRTLGGGGIFTRQALDYVKSATIGDKPDRIIVFSDSQDCDFRNKKLPEPFGKTNYIMDVSANSRGINYSGVWTAEVSGWSEHFLDFIRSVEGLDGTGEEDSLQ